MITKDKERAAALREIQNLLGGRYTIDAVASACCDMLVQTVGVMQDTPERCDALLDDLVADCRRTLRTNWQELQASRLLMLEPEKGRA